VTVHDAGELGAGVVEHLLGLVQGVVSCLQRVHVRLALGHIGDGLILQVFADFEYIAAVSHRLDHGLGNVGRLFGIALGVQRVNSCYVGVPATAVQ